MHLFISTARKNKLFLQQIFDVHSGMHTVLGTANEQGCSDLVPVSIALTYQWERQTTYMENLFGKKKKVVRQECDERKMKRVM